MPSTLRHFILLGMFCCASAGAASPVSRAPALKAAEGAAAPKLSVSSVGSADGAKDAPGLRGGGGPAALEAKIELACENLLGEAPMWHDVEQRLYWLDINGKKLWSYAPGTSEARSWDLPEVAGSFAFREGGGFLMGFVSGLSWFDPETGAVDKVCGYEEGLNTRPNDGKCDREGNFVIGSYNNNHRQDQQNIAGLWRLSAGDLGLTEILDYRFRCSNTIAFDGEGSAMYFCDTPTKKIYKFDYAPDAPLSNKRLFAEMAAEDAGGPDGATVDSEGGVWVAQAGNWRVVRYRASDGEVDYEVKLPFNNPTSCSIGGEDMDTLFITTARHRLSEQERKEQPGAGQLWSLKLPNGIKGLPEPRLKA